MTSGPPLADLLLHPVRLRVVEAFLGGRVLTTSQLRAELPDVAPATLYRHVGRLAAAGVLEVVAEQRVRGTTERSYRLDVPATRLSPEDLAGLSVEDHRRMFAAFVAGLLGEYDRYLASGPPDLAADGAGYHMAGLWLDDAELLELHRGFARLLAEYAGNGPTGDRRRRLLRMITFPATDP